MTGKTARLAHHRFDVADQLVTISVKASDDREIEVSELDDVVSSGYRAPPRHSGLLVQSGGYPSFSEVHYAMLELDEQRTRAYEAALRVVAPGKVGVDLGTGAHLFLARKAIAAGARHMFAVEEIESSFQTARQTIAAEGLEDRVTLLHGRSQDVTLPTRVDFCVSEVIGSIGSWEGAIEALPDARERWLKPGGLHVPDRCVTKIAACQLPDDLHGKLHFLSGHARLLQQIFRYCGRPFDIGVDVWGLRREHLKSTAATFESLEFNQLGSNGYAARNGEVQILVPGRIDGFALWIELYGHRDGTPIVSIDPGTCWVPAFFPAFYPGVQVNTGDRIALQIQSRLSKDGKHPDYDVTAVVNHETYEVHQYHSPTYRHQNRFYRDLYSLE